MNLNKIIKKIYYKIPLNSFMRYRISLWRRKAFFFMGINATSSLGRGLTYDLKKSALMRAPAESQQKGSTSRIKPSNGQRDYIFFGVIDWHFRHQRPQQMAQAIAQAGHRVFYISVNFCNQKHPGFHVETLHEDLSLYQVLLNIPGHHSVYASPPAAPVLQRLRESQAALWQECEIRKAVHVVQHPYWYGLASHVPFARLIYDCMDFHAGFSDNGNHHDAAEMSLLKLADLTVVTSSYLQDFAHKSGAQKVALIRNAAEYEHFHQASVQEIQPKSQPVIGYYGAIADWFDPVVIETLSQKFSQARIELIGDDSARVQARLSHCTNVKFHGEIPYAQLPQ
jgi:hypothetical protein